MPAWPPVFRQDIPVEKAPSKAQILQSIKDFLEVVGKKDWGYIGADDRT